MHLSETQGKHRPYYAAQEARVFLSRRFALNRVLAIRVVLAEV